MIKYSKDFVVVKTDKLLFQEKELDGENGLQILIDASFEPVKHVVNFGEVVSVPDRLSHRPWGINMAGKPKYFEFDEREVLWVDQLPITVQKGDKVYFHYNQTMKALDNGPIHEEVIDGKKYYYLKIEYQYIFCSIRDNEVIPNATWTLIEPAMESWEDILHPVPEMDKDGNIKTEIVTKFDEKGLAYQERVPKLKPKEEWIQMKVAPEAVLREGYVRHIGNPVIDGYCDLNQGDKILYRTHADLEVNIENVNYFLIKQHHISGIITT